jgi:hypothetical protein
MIGLGLVSEDSRAKRQLRRAKGLFKRKKYN